MNAFRGLKMLLIFAALLGAGEAVASSAAKSRGWDDLRLHLTLQEAAAIMVGAMGNPVMVHRGRNGLYEQWFYDGGGWLFFQRGRLEFWRRSSPLRKDPVER